MLSVVLAILKFIGITILVILGILILTLLLVLFVPVRYKANGFYRETYRIQAKITWLLHIVSFVLLYEKEKPFHMKLRIFGITVFDNLNKKEKKQRKRKKDKKPVSEPKPEIVASSIPEKSQEIVSIPENLHEQNEKMFKGSKIEVANQKETEVKKTKKEKVSLSKKIKLVFSKVISFFQNIKYTFHKIYVKIKKAKDNITYYKELLQKETTKEAFRKCKKQLLRIFKNVKPQKFQVNLHIGVEDPATMGDILGVWGMLYPLHEGHVDICPDFENVVMEGEFFCKGRVTVYIYIWTLIIVFFDKNIRQLRECLVQEGK